MLPIFVALAIVGVGLLLMQSIGGGEADADVDGFDLDGDGELDSHDVPWLPLASLRFWALALAAAGIIGTLGLTLTDTPREVVALVAGISGVVIGWVGNFSLSYLARGASSSTNEVQAGRGRVARVVTPIGEGSRGKIRLELKGQLVDLVARADAPIEVGAEVVVMDIDGSEAQVVRAPNELTK